MPSVSKKQSRAMFAACAGKSNIGIPKSVGCEFARADMAKAKRHKMDGSRRPGSRK